MTLQCQLAASAPCGAKCSCQFLPLCAAALLRAGSELSQPGGAAHRLWHHPEAAPGPAERTSASPEDAGPAGGSSAG